MSDVIAAKHDGDGTSAVHVVPEDAAWKIAAAIFRTEGGADAVEEHRAEHYMVATSYFNGAAWGTLMGAWIEPLDEQRITVTVVTKRRMALGALTTLTESTFQEEFRRSVMSHTSAAPH